jgi:hypothetical protein
MEKLNENRISPLVNRGDFTRGIPFYGSKGDFNFTIGRSQFTPGISIKQATLTDLSHNGDPGISSFGQNIATLRAFFKPGDRIRGLLVNSQLADENGKMIVGKLHKILPDHSNNTIRVWIKNPKDLKVQEVYVESIEKIYETFSNRALSFSQFINS